MIEIHTTKPEGFTAHVEVAGCYLEIEGKLLLLQRPKDAPEAEKWGVPAGKLEKNETPEDAAKRELFEETGIALPRGKSQMHYLHSLYIRKPHIDYTFHLFKVHMDQIPPVCLSDENINYKWASPKEIEEIPLMAGAKEALALYRVKANFH